MSQSKWTKLRLLTVHILCIYLLAFSCWERHQWQEAGGRDTNQTSLKPEPAGNVTTAQAESLTLVALLAPLRCGEVGG